MEWTLVNWQTVFADEAPDRTAVIITAQPAHFLRDLNLAANFTRYGAVESIRYERHSGCHYAIIQFDNAASANNLLRNDSIVLRGVDFVVKPFHSIEDLINSIQRKNFTHPSSGAAPENADKNILNNLNDDCLAEIFRRIHSLSDVAAIVDVCLRFRRIAQTAFNPLLKRKQIQFTELRAGRNVTLMVIDRFLRHFGSSIVSVLLCEEYFQNMPDVVNPMLKLMQIHCPNLKSLTLYKDNNLKELDCKTVIDTRPLLSKLKHVEIWHKSEVHIFVENYVGLISACTDVETLIVNIYSYQLVFPEINLPKLKAFHTIAISSLRSFLAQNQQIEKLVCPWESGLGSLIAEKIPNIREIFLRRISAEDDILDLKRLKVAKVSLLWADIDLRLQAINRIENITSLRFIVLGFSRYDILRGLTRQLWNLDSLSFYYTCDGTYQSLSKNIIKKILQHATKLTKLKIRLPPNYTYDIHENDYNEILQVVQTRSDPSLKLHMVLDSTTRRGDAEHGIKTIHRNVDHQWLTMTTRYTYFTRMAGGAREEFERRAAKACLSSRCSYDFVPSEHDKYIYNVI